MTLVQRIGRFRGSAVNSCYATIHLYRVIVGAGACLDKWTDWAGSARAPYALRYVIAIGSWPSSTSTRKDGADPLS